MFLYSVFKVPRRIKLRLCSFPASRKLTPLRCCSFSPKRRRFGGPIKGLSEQLSLIHSSKSGSHLLFHIVSNIVPSAA